VRRLLHRQVAAALETLYAGHIEEVAAQLMRHYVGDAAQERHYARIAGERAAARFANDEALRLLSHALELTPETDRLARYDLLLAREEVYEVQGDRAAQTRDLGSLEDLVAGEQAGSQAAARRASVALLRAHFANVTSDYGSAIAAAQSQLAAASALARQTDARQVEADTLRTLGAVAVDRGAYVVGRACYDQALGIYRQIGDRRGESATLNNLGVAARVQGELADAFYVLGRCLDTAGNAFPRVRPADDAALDQAANAYRRALTLRVTLQQTHPATEPLAGLAWVALAEGESARALNRVQPRTWLFVGRS
jgi:tetratricopeptide (TPR) repeat protein